MNIHLISLSLPLLLILSNGIQADSLPASKQSQPQQAETQNMISLMSFNIRYGAANDGPNAWPLRQHMVSDLIRREMPDFLCTQEMQQSQSNYLQKKLPEYAILQKERDATPSSRSEMCGLFYQKERWSLDPQEHGTFWLSATPEVPGSMGTKAGCPRVVTWGRFTEKETGRSLYVYNTHFDHRSDTARREAAKLIAQRMATRSDPKTPAVMMGDLNADETSWPLRYLLGKTSETQPPLQLVDPFRVLHPEATPVGTFTGFKQGDVNGAKIDYLLTTPELKPIEAEILRNSHEDRYPSDHFPVTLKVEFP